MTVPVAIRWEAVACYRSRLWLMSMNPTGHLVLSTSISILVIPATRYQRSFADSLLNARRGRCEARNRRPPDIVGLRQFFERGTFGLALADFFLLLRCELRRSAHMLPFGLGAAPAFGGTGADKIALHVRQSAENGNHESPGAGAGVGPRFGQ